MIWNEETYNRSAVQSAPVGCRVSCSVCVYKMLVDTASGPPSILDSPTLARVERARLREEGSTTGRSSPMNMSTYCPRSCGQHGTTKVDEKRTLSTIFLSFPATLASSPRFPPTLCSRGEG
ncbi:hypothetical protein J6590_027657 [Homalodisca vitripennis]|nr:hypothetical protein J6590_027657 [Homalodisca vitripennis]